MAKPRQLEMFPEPEPERQIELFEPAPVAEPEAAQKERRRLKLIRLDDPRRPRNRRVTLVAAILATVASMPALADDRPICQSTTTARTSADKADVARIEHKLDVLAACLLLHHCEGSQYPWVPAH